MDPLFGFTGKISLLTWGSRGSANQGPLAFYRYELDSARSAALAMRSSTTGPKACNFSSSPARWKPCSSTIASFHRASTS